MRDYLGLGLHGIHINIANRISMCFTDEISKIRTYLDDVKKSFSLDQGPEVQLVHCGDHLTSIDVATEDEVMKIIMSFASKSNILDPIPTY